jgi:DNA-binding XRE family transcriptional regulator
LRAGLTQQQLARQLHLSHQAVQKWEKGSVGCGRHAKLAQVLRCSLDDLRASLC